MLLTQMSVPTQPQLEELDELLVEDPDEELDDDDALAPPEPELLALDELLVLEDELAVDELLVDDAAPPAPPEELFAVDAPPGPELLEDASAPPPLVELLEVDAELDVGAPPLREDDASALPLLELEPSTIFFACTEKSGSVMAHADANIIPTDATTIVLTMTPPRAGSSLQPRP